MSDDAVDYGGTGSSDAESESDQVPSRLPARAESFKVWAHVLSVLHAGLVDILQMIVCPSLRDRDDKEAVTVEQLT